MSLLRSDPIAISQDAFVSSATQLYPLGTRAIDKDGRKFRYVLAGTPVLVVGNVLQGPAAQPTHQTLAVTDPTALAATGGLIGSDHFTVTLGITNAVVENEYTEGWAMIELTPGLGYAYPIDHHAAAAGAAALVVYIDPETPIQVSLTDASKVTLVRNPWKGVIQSPATTLTGAPVGVAIYPITAAQYGWIQSGGPCAMLCTDVQAVGEMLCVPGTEAGSATVSALHTTPIIGYTMGVTVAACACPVYLTID